MIGLLKRLFRKRPDDEYRVGDYVAFRPTRGPEAQLGLYGRITHLENEMAVISWINIGGQKRKTVVPIDEVCGRISSGHYHYLTRNC